MFKLFKALYAALKGLPAALFAGWIPAIRHILRFLCKKLHRCLKKLWGCLKAPWSKSGTTHVPSHAPAIPINHPAYKKPDPLIYDQYYLMSLGLAVSWQNPDIQISKGGVPVASAYDLLPDTTYDVTATIWNGSTSGVISGMPVIFSYLSFGAATKSNYIGATVIDLGVIGSKHAPAKTTMQWTTPATPGHYCIQVSFSWIDDANPFNNLGQENTQVVQALSPAEFSFAVGNASRNEVTYRFEFDTYSIPAAPPCPPTPPPANARDNNIRGNAPQGTRRVAASVPPGVAARHLRSNFPLPPGWTIAFDPPAPVVPGETEIPINVTVTPPDSFHGSLPLNIHTFAGNALVGGVTIIVNRA